MDIPGEKTDQLAHLLPHGCCTSSQVILKQLTDETLEDQDLPKGWVSGQCTEQRDTVTRDSWGTAITLGWGGVAAAQHGECPVLTGSEGGLVAAAAAGWLGGSFSLLKVVLQELFTRCKHFLWIEKSPECYGSEGKKLNTPVTKNFIFLQ